MNVICVHIGHEIPEYVYHNLKNTASFGLSTLYMICEKKHFRSIGGVNWVDIEPYLNSKENREFEQCCYLDEYGLNGFWKYAMQRFYVLEAFALENRIREFVHHENDVVVFVDPGKIANTLKDCYKGKIAINVMGKLENTAAYIYVDSVEVMSRLNRDMANCLKMDRGTLIKKMNADMVNEMKIMNYILLKNNYLQILPMFTEGPYSINVRRFDLLFDGASWGQYIDGTPIGHKSGVLFNHHVLKDYIGSGSICWEGKRPYFLYKKKKYWFNNLHIHSKNVKNFVLN